MSDTSPEMLARILAAYQKVRSMRADLKRKYEEEDSDLKRKLNLMEVELMRIMEKTGTDQLKVDGVGLAYRSENMKFKGNDWPAIWQWIQETGNLGTLQRRLASGSLKDYMEENDGALPPGVGVSVERTVVVRRS
jgi:uncharacterized protein YfaQ (DUF2300 family)